MKKIEYLIRLMLFFGFVVLFNNTKISAQSCTNITLTIDIDGAQSLGCCNVCGDDYWCFGGGCGCCQAMTLNRTFVDPVPAGNVVYQITVTYYVSDCGGTSMPTTINGTSVGSAVLGGYTCNCGECNVHPTSSTNYGCNGFPGYNYGGVNTLVGTPNGEVCVDRVVLTICYGPANPNPGTASVSPNTICSGQSVTLTASGYVGTFQQWQISTDGGVTWSNIPGATTPTYTYGPLTSNACFRSRITSCNQTVYSNMVCVTVNPLPSPTASSNSPICAGQTLNLTGGPNGMSSYSWTGPNGFSSNLQNPSIPNATTAASGTYTLTVTNGFGCSASTTTNVVVNPLPNPNPSSNSPICAGQTLNLFSAGGFTSYSWTGPNSFSSNVQNPSIPNATTAASGTYTVTVTGSNGCTNSASTNVTVNPVPSVSVANDTVCLGQNGTLTAVVSPSGGTYSWSPGGYTTQTINVTVTSTTTFNVTYTLSTGCSNTASGTIVVYPNPTVQVNDTVTCAGQPVTLTANVNPPGGSFLWSNGQTTQSITVAPTTPSTYTVTYTDPNGCSASDNATVNILPGGIVNADFNAPSNICINNMPVSYINTGSTGAGYSYQWYLGAGATPPTLTTQDALNIIYATSGGKIVSLVVTNSYGCKDSVSKTVFIEPQPNITFSAQSPVCIGDSMFFTNNSWVGGTGVISQWVWDFGDGNYSGQFQPWHTYLSPGTYTVQLKAMSDYGCADSSTITVEVSPLSVGGQLLQDDTVCSGQNSGMLQLTGNTGTPVQWEYSTDGGINWFAISNTGVQQPYNNLTQDRIYRVLVKSGACPAVYSDTVMIKVDALSEGGVVLRDTLVCIEGNSGILLASGYNGTIVTWQVSTDGGQSWQNTNTSGVVESFTNLTDTTLYRVIVKNGVCPADTSAYATVWVRKFNGAYTSGDTTISLGDRVQVYAGGGMSYLWRPNVNINDTTISNPEVWPVETQQYTVVVWDEYGCADTSQLTVYVIRDYKLEISNTLTPNGDGYNDTWWIGNIENYPANEVQIFNRYGQLIYSKEGYMNEWDGRYKGERLPNGTYFFVLKIKEGEGVVFKGHINIIGK
ncbi:MAG: hypothetical protein KatS3mg034_1861 [Vicingaceae bacterium]|nr:MAG: hypothetical protein KatS3mg034_1861 [Vicingaceae bacterium]